MDNLKLAECLKTIDTMSAAEVADMFLSAYIHPEKTVELTKEPGPSMWIVNRSDVYSQTLEVMLKHPVEGMAIRAAEKLKLRKATVKHISPPIIDKKAEELEDFEVEDALGHPLCPFEYMSYFSENINPDWRLSSCLSLTRRLLEHAPDWSVNQEAKNSIQASFLKLLLEDPNDIVRAYADRIPLFEEAHIQMALEKENNAFVFGRLLQNPACSKDLLNNVLNNSVFKNSHFAQRVYVLDQRSESSSHINDKLALLIKDL